VRIGVLQAARCDGVKEKSFILEHYVLDLEESCLSGQASVELLSANAVSSSGFAIVSSGWRRKQKNNPTLANESIL